MSTPENQSYLSAGINKLSSWSPRAQSPKPPNTTTTSTTTTTADGDLANAGLKDTRGGDHRVSHRRGPSLRAYPRDCPLLTVQWFFAVDVPKRKPNLGNGPAVEKPKGVPRKYASFSNHDSRAIEAAFQKLTKDGHTTDRKLLVRKPDGDIGNGSKLSYETLLESDGANRNQNAGTIKVPVNEDFLFDVDIEERELAPAYWLGPVYEVRRGTWFQQDGSVQKPCDENLAVQLEEGFLKITPWRWPQARSASQPRSRTSSVVSADGKSEKGPAQIVPKSSSPDLRKQSKETDLKIPESARAATYRLFGPYSNSVVTYQDANTAWILTDDFLSRMSSTVYQRFAGGSHFAGIKVTRGYVSPPKKDAKTEVRASSKERAQESPDQAKDGADQVPEDAEDEPLSETKRRNLERHMSSLVASATSGDREQQEEEVRRRDEQEIQDDYQDQDSQEQDRQIEHLMLVTHGIGQRLGLRMETVNFIHDVNTFRKTLKSVYGNAPDLQALNSEVDKLPKNCRLQVLPINWRDKLDFPKQSLRHNRKERERDLGDAAFGDDDEYPNLEDLTIEGVPAVRNLITDLALDILLYTSPIYNGHISRIVVDECNHIYKLFKQRQPSFKGKVSLVGHSLGSAIFFDILCTQREETSSRKLSVTGHRKPDDRLKLDFEVEDFYALGSPIGLFQMLQGRQITARQAQTLAARAMNNEGTETLLSAAANAVSAKLPESDPTTDLSISSPKCRQIFNIFHPTDPISYRIEPLISSAMSALKPQPLPYTKRGIFGTQVGQGLTGIGNSIGQSVSGLWSSFSSGIASSLINRSLGFSAEDEAKLHPQGSSNTKSSKPLSMAASVGLTTGPISGNDNVAPEKPNTSDELRQQLAASSLKEGEDGQHPPTLIETEIQTLYSGFKGRPETKGSHGDSSKEAEDEEDWEESSERVKKLRKEEAKVRALNSNGRVDYSIQEGAFDISLIAAVASHLSYWSDEDVSHFMISQLLSRHRVIKKTSSEKIRA